MPYRPKFCCECGDKIERVEWKLTASRRFCELCETNFKVHELIPGIALIGGIILMIFGFGSFWMRSPKPLNIAQNQLSGSSQNNFKNSAKIPNENVSNPTPKPEGNQSPPKLQPKLVSAANMMSNAPIKQPETSFFCGAQTKKGTPCSRRVKGGGRCWQHIGQAAMPSTEKSVANQ